MPTLATNNTAISVGTSNAVVSEQKLNGYSERVRLIITNVSTAAQAISVSVGNEAIANQGLVLNVGGFISWEKVSGLPIPQSRVFAIGSAAGGSLAVYEEVINYG